MNRSNLTKVQVAALEKIAAAGPNGLPEMEGRKVSVNGHCAQKLFDLGLIVERVAPYRLTGLGEEAVRGVEFEPARIVHFVLWRDGRSGFAVPPTFNKQSLESEWMVLHSDPEVGGTRSMREDEFRMAYPLATVHGGTCRERL